MRAPRPRFPLRVLSRCAVFALAFALPAGPGRAEVERPNLFEWVAVARVVVVATEIEAAGKYTHFHIDDVLRGEVPVGREVRIKVRRANRERDREVDRRALKPLAGGRYVLLLAPAATKKADAPTTFELVRGVQGALELPAEGAPALLAALQRFIRIQDLRDERATWREMRALLEETDPRLLEVALEQFLKFHRGTADLVGTLRPLLEHPSQGLRERTARLLGQILGRRGEPVPELMALRNDLVSRARRDSSVPVRIAATRALGDMDWATVGTVIEEIAREDPDQAVRYAAETILYERRQEARNAPGGTR